MTTNIMNSDFRKNIPSLPTRVLIEGSDAVIMKIPCVIDPITKLLFTPNFFMIIVENKLPIPAASAKIASA